MEIAIAAAILVGIVRGVRGRRDRRARSNLTRALRGIQGPSDFKPARYPGRRWLP